MTTPDIYYCIPAKSAVSSIGPCLDSLAGQTFKGKVNTIICLNGEDDGTSKVVDAVRQRHPQLGINVIHSRKGIAFALNAIIRHINTRSVPLMFVDADVILDRCCIARLYQQLHEVKRLLIVGAWPIPLEPAEATTWTHLLFRILHARALWPQGEVAYYDVSQYKPWLETHPQSAVPASFEKRSRVYFHGRAYMLRNSSYFYLPENEDIVDDTFISNYIHKQYGLGSIRIRYDAMVYYQPILSLKTHFHVYRRYYLDCWHFDRSYPDFTSVRKYEKTRLDWSFIRQQTSRVQACFLAYHLISKCEKLLFYILPKKKVSDMWR